MVLEELLQKEEFLKILDRENSEDMIEYLYYNLPGNEYALVADMCKDLGIFQDIAMCGADPNKKYKYIIHKAFNNKTHDAVIDTRGAKIFCDGIWNPANCEIILDSTTTICWSGIRISPNNDKDKFKLTFLGIPKFEEVNGIIIRTTFKQIEVRTKADIANEVKELFRGGYILPNREALKTKIKEI